MKRDSFVFRGEWKDAIADLPAGVRLEIYEAVIEYGTSGTIPALKQMALLAFNFMKTAIDRDRERYEDAARERSEKASVRWNRDMRTDAIDANACERSERMQTQRTHANDANAENAMRTDANVCYNVLVLDNDNKEKVSKETKKKAASAAERAEAVVEAATKELTDEVAAYDYPEAMKTAFVSYWTEPNKSRTRVRYQMEKTWDTSRRLSLWASRDKVSKATKPTEIGRTEFSHDYDKPW